MTFAGAAEDRLAIRELMERYADAVFRHDSEAWIGCWREDGVWHFAGMTLTGREAILAAWRQAMAAFAFAAFHVQPGAIEVDGDTASARSWTREFFLPVAGGTRTIAGRYDDELVRTPEGWRFAVRRYTLLHDDAPPGQLESSS